MAVANFNPDHMPEIPFYSIVANNHKDIGVQMGKYMKEQVKCALAADLNLKNKMVPWYNTSEGQKVYNELYDANKKVFPEYIEELEGLAEGSDAPLFELFMYSLSEEFSYLLKGEFEFQPDTHCSDYAVMDDDMVHICHNEDGSYSSVGNMSLVEVKLIENEKITSHYIAAVYGAQIATNAFGWNFSGILFTMNYVKPLTFINNGIARIFVARKLLDAKSYDEAYEIVTMKNQMCGRNYQIMDVKTKKILCIETANDGKFGKYELSNGNPHFHANNYNIMKIEMDVDPSSVYRQKRADEMKKPHTIDESLNVLGDTENREWPLYRGGVKRRYTLCTSVYDLNTNKILILLDNPKDPKNRRVNHEFDIIIE